MPVKRGRVANIAPKSAEFAWFSCQKGGPVPIRPIPGSAPGERTFLIFAFSSQFVLFLQISSWFFQIFGKFFTIKLPPCPVLATPLPTSDSPVLEGLWIHHYTSKSEGSFLERKQTQNCIHESIPCKDMGSGEKEWEYSTCWGYLFLFLFLFFFFCFCFCFWLFLFFSFHFSCSCLLFFFFFWCCCCCFVCVWLFLFVWQNKTCRPECWHRGENTLYSWVCQGHRYKMNL